MGGASRSKQDKFRRGLVYIKEAFQLSTEEFQLLHFIAFRRLFGEVNDEEENLLITPMSKRFKKAFSAFKEKFPGLFSSDIHENCRVSCEKSF